MYIAFLIILSVSFILMPFGINSDGETNILVYISGLLFWSGLIGTIISAIMVNSTRKADANEDNSDVKRLGLIHFFTNTPAKIADVVMIVSLVVFIFLIIFNSAAVLKFIFISLFVFSFGMHCMLNGLNYNYINESQKRGESHYEKGNKNS